MTIYIDADACPVGRNIHTLLEDKLNSIQEAMEKEMRKRTAAELHDGIRDFIAKEA